MSWAPHHDASRAGNKRRGRRTGGARSLAVGATCIVMTACGFGSIGDAQTGAELAPSLEPLRDVAPEHHRRLVDGTYDSLSFLEQWDFVAEVQEIVREQRETNRGELEAAWRQSLVELLDSIETLPPESAERRLASSHEHLLLLLKGENDALAVHPQ